MPPGTKPKAKPEQTPPQNQEKPTPEPPSIPCKGNGPMAGYPVPSGATHWRLHTCDGQGRIEKAITLETNADNEPVTRAPVSTLGDARWWDVMPKAGGFVRLTFVRMHGDSIIAPRFGQGPMWTPQARREGVVSPGATTPAEPAAAAPPIVAASGGGTDLFVALMKLQDIADAKAEKRITETRLMYEHQGALTRDFMSGMVQMVTGVRREERTSEERQAARRDKVSAKAIADAVAAGIEAAREDDDDDDDDDNDDKKKVQDTADMIFQTVSGLGDLAKPLLVELGKRAIS